MYRSAGFRPLHRSIGVALVCAVLWQKKMKNKERKILKSDFRLFGGFHPMTSTPLDSSQEFSTEHPDLESPLLTGSFCFAENVNKSCSTGHFGLAPLIIRKIALVLQAVVFWRTGMHPKLWYVVVTRSGICGWDPKAKKRLENLQLIQVRIWIRIWN